MPERGRVVRSQSCDAAQRGIGDVPRVVGRQTAPVSLIIIHSTIEITRMRCQHVAHGWRRSCRALTLFS